MTVNPPEVRADTYPGVAVCVSRLTTYSSLGRATSNVTDPSADAVKGRDHVSTVRVRVPCPVRVPRAENVTVAAVVPLMERSPTEALDTDRVRSP